VLYEGLKRDGSPFALALRFDREGRAEPFAPPPPQPLPKTRIWRIPRATHADAPAGATVARTLEDTPFYARSELTTRLLGQTTQAVHESLFLDRFAQPIVQAMLPFRMPRRGGRQPQAAAPGAAGNSRTT
jgi:carotenoid 1,2-hydratase